MPSLRSRRSLFDPKRGDDALRIQHVRLKKSPHEPARTNYFTVYAVKSGSGTFWADAAAHPFSAGSLLFFVPYQYLRFEPATPVEAEVIRFHANFLCVETFHAESGCSGALFNDPYNSPAVPLDEATRLEVAELLDRLHREQADRRLAHDDVSLAYLKVLLVLATRLKLSSNEACRSGGADPRHPVLTPLRELIEQHYRTLHAPADYAELLHMTPKTLGRIVREHLGQTLTDLIRGRILTHAKWQLLHTLRPVKEIAREVGYADELYFSRLFKKGTGVSPTFFREFETRIRGGSNLSMLSDHAPIQGSSPRADNPTVPSRRSRRVGT